MCCKSWKAILPFAIAFLVGLYATNLIVNIPVTKNNVERKTEVFYVTPVTSDAVSESCLPPSHNSKSSLKILSKPRATYTELARNNQTQGTVTLRVAFLANGEIGNIAPISSLPDGLTEQSINAAKQMKFEPAMKDGKAVTVVKQVQYNFTLY